MAQLQKSTQTTYPTLICLQAEALAKTSAWLESKPGLVERGVDYSFSSSGYLKKNNLLITSLKMLKELYQARTDGILQGCKLKWPKQGLVSSGRYLMPNVSRVPQSRERVFVMDTEKILDKLLFFL